MIYGKLFGEFCFDYNGEGFRRNYGPSL